MNCETVTAFQMTTFEVAAHDYSTSDIRHHLRGIEKNVV